MKSQQPPDRTTLTTQEPLSAIDPTRRPFVEKRAADMPKKYRSGYLRAAAGKASPRKAIWGHCLECCGWQRREVELCTGYACPLYLYRGNRL